MPTRTIDAHDWDVDFLRPIVAATFEIFGGDRCLWGSNFPVDGLYSSYRAVVEAYERVVADLGLSADEQDAFFYRNAERVYRLCASPGARGYSIAETAAGPPATAATSASRYGGSPSHGFGSERSVT